MRRLALAVAGVLAWVPYATGAQADADDAVPVSTTEFRGVWYGCGSENTLPGHQFVYAGGKATYSAWHRPMAVFAPEVGKTFFVFGDSQNRPAISAYDHATGAFAPPIALGANPDGNAHRNPTLLIDEAGYLYVFYGYAGGGQPIHVLRSSAPYAITHWLRRPDLTDGKGSYPQPWQLKAGEIFVTHRIPQGWCYRISKDGGATWSTPVELASFSTYESTSTVYGFTAAETGAYPRKIHFAWSRLGGGSAEAMRTKHLWARRYNVYYACSDDGGITWHRSDGTPYTLPIREDTAEKIYDSGEHGVWLNDMQIDPDGHPVILFNDADTDTFASAWKVARHADGAWRISDLTATDHMYDGGALVLLAKDDFRVYGPTTPVQPRCDGGEIEEWTSRDQGRTWQNTRHITTGSTFSHNHVKAVYNHERGTGDLRIIWSYGDGQSPPKNKEVRLFCYGERTGQAREIAEKR